MQHTLRIFALALCMAGSLCSGCSKTKVTKVQQDPSFADEALLSDGLWVIAMTTSPDMRQAQEFDSAHATSRMEARLRESRKDMRIRSGEDLQAQIVGDAQLNLVREYQTTGSWPPDLFDLLEAIGPDPRYILSARLIRNNVHRRARDCPGDDDDNYCLMREREIRVEVQILDRVERKTVYDAQLETQKSKVNEISPERRINDDTSLWTRFLNTLFRSGPPAPKETDFAESDYPEPPSLEDVLDILYSDLGEMLPGS